MEKIKHKYFTSPFRPWDKIESHFDDGEHPEMLALVKHIGNSDLSKRLYGSTSLYKLVISIYEEIDYSKEAIHITFGLHMGAEPPDKWLFKYFAKPMQDPEFVRIYEREKGIKKFDQFIKMLNW